MKKFILLFLFAISINAFAQVPSYVPSSGLVCWLPFNGNANDESGNGYNGTVNGATLTSDRNSNANSAYSFNGVNNVINTFQTTIPITGNYTISVWVYGISNAGVNRAAIAQGGTFVNSTHIGHTANGNIRVGTGQSWGWDNIPSFPFDLWHQFVVVKNTTISRLYLDGVIFDSSVVYTNPINSGDFRIGNNQNNLSNEWWLGKIDDIGIWNRVLTQSEITALYQSQPCTATITAQPINQNVISGNNAYFFIFSADTSLSYHWQTNLGFGWQTLSNAGQYSGVNNDTLTILNTTLANNNQMFRCYITSGSCSDTSNSAFLSCCPNIISQPINQNIVVGNSALFISTYSALNSTYQWETNIGLGWNNISNAGQFNGANNDSLIVSNTTLANNNQLFRCIFSSGSCIDTSNIATLNILPSSVVSLISDASIKVQLSPNPTNGLFNISFNNVTNQQVNYVVTNVLGQIVFENSFTENEGAVNRTIELNDVAAGIYSITVKTATGIVTKQTLITK